MMLKRIKSIAFCYGLPLLAYILILSLIIVLSKVAGFSLDLTTLIIGLMIVTAWFLGRNPGLFIAVIFEITLVYFQILTTPYTAKSAIISFNRMLLFGSLIIFVSSRRKAEKKLREQSELLQVTISSIGDAVIATDLQGKINFINPTAESLTGWEMSEARNKQLEEIFNIINEETRLEVESPFSAVIREGVIVGLANHTILISKDGREIPIEDSGAPIKDADGKIIGVIIVFHDVSERRQSEKERELLLQSEQSARREAETAGILKDEFLATVSHELRTPLNAILGWSATLSKSNVQDKEVLNALEIIKRSAQAQAKIVSDILDVSHIITGKLQLQSHPLELAGIVRNAVETLRPAAIAKSINITLALDENAGTVLGDADRLQQIIWNLAANAIKFTPHGGAIEITLKAVDSHLELKITDNGMGISKQFLPFVFDRFRQLDSSITRTHGGLGLGLSIVRHLAELHGGTVFAESEGEGKGAVFMVRLPSANEIEAFEAGADSDAEFPQFIETADDSKNTEELKGLHILAVDDDADTLEVLKFVLERLGANVQIANSSAVALETFLQGKFDVIVSDLGMPLEDGYSLIGKIRTLSSEQGGTVPAIAVSGYARNEDRDQALAAGFQTHVSKPVDPLILASIIAKLAREHKL